MTDPIATVLAIAALVSIVDWIAVGRDDRRREQIAKPGVMALLIAAVVLAGPGASPVRWLLIAALVASLAGDVLLLPPVTAGRFAAGLAAFLVAHLAYLGLFVLGDLRPGPAALGAVGAIALLATVGRPILAGARRAGLGGPVAAYFAAICLMAIAATASGSVPAAIGAWLFVASDAFLGWDRFVAPPAVTRGAASRRRLGVMVTYHAAQLLLTLAVLGSPA